MNLDAPLSIDTPTKSIVSVLVVDIVESTTILSKMGPEDSELFLNKCFAHFRKVIENRGGTIFHFTGDGAVAVFGWPKAFDAHADLACHAARDIIETDARFNIPGFGLLESVKYRVGVHSDATVVRKIQTAGGQRLDAVGATVHLASALQKSAPSNGVVISEQTRALCRLAVDVTPLNEPLSSSATPQKKYRLNGIDFEGQLNSQKNRRSTFVGREAELAHIKNNFPTKGGGKKSLCLIGDPGIGKSTLLREAWRIADQEGLKRVVVFCNPLMRASPYFVIKQLFHQLSENQVCDDLNGFLKNLSLEDEDFNIVQKIIEPVDSKPLNVTQRRTSQAFMKALDAAIGTDLTLMCIEDVHLMDGESQRILADWRVSQLPLPCLLILSSRPEGQALCYQIASEVLNIDALNSDVMYELAETLLPEFIDEDEKITQLVNRADGVPFILEQLARSIGGQHEQEQEFDLLPLTIESAIHSQINRLSPEAQQALQILSVIGNDYTPQIISKILGQEFPNLLSLLSELEDYGFIEQTSAALVRFRHDILLDASIRTLHRDKKTEIHQSIYDVLLKSEREANTQQFVLAFHAHSSGQLKKSLEHYWNAALAALRTHSARSLDEIFDQAMHVIQEIGPDANDRYVDFVLMAFDSMQQIGNVQKISALLPRAIELARQQGRVDKECLGLAHMALARWFEGRNVEGLPISERAFALAKEINSLPLIYYAQFQLATTFYSLGDIKKGVELQSEMVEVLSGDLKMARLGASVIPGSISRSFLAYKLADLGEFERAENICLEAMEIARKCKQPYSITMASMTTGRLYNIQGRYVEAEPILREGHELILSQGLHPGYGSMSSQFSICLSRLGHYQEALEIAEDCIKSGHLSLGAVYNVCLLRMAHYEALRAHGRYSRAEETLEKGISIARQVKDPITLAKLLSAPARVDAHTQSKTTGYEAHLKEAKALAKMHNIILPHPFDAY